MTKSPAKLSLQHELKAAARRLGFDPVGIAPAGAADDFEHLRDWLDKGCAGAMKYMARHADARRHPSSILPAVRSVMMVGLNYKPGSPASEESGRGEEAGTPGGGADPLAASPSGSKRGGGEPDTPLLGRIARYAAGLDYHEVMWRKLEALLAWLQTRVPGCHGRGVVDTAPLLERDFARRAGLGWIGKNTMLINKRLGSYLFLGALLLDCEIDVDQPFTPQHCGTCTRCLDACPTDAFAAPFRLDARRCISYLTIELRGPVPEELRAGLGDWIFGCDICQEVCPWNHKAPVAAAAELGPVEAGLTTDLVALLSLSEAEFRQRYRHTALWRARRRGLLRNAAIVLGNLGDARALPALQHALTDVEPLVREAAEWAIGRLQARASTR